MVGDWSTLSRSRSRSENDAQASSGDSDICCGLYLSNAADSRSRRAA